MIMLILRRASVTGFVSRLQDLPLLKDQLKEFF
jgi:hypothetical protein